MKILHLLIPIFSLLLLAGSAPAAELEGPPFRHAVFFQFKESATEKDIERIVAEFLLLEEKIDTIVDIEWGESESVEGLNGDFTHCFFVTFRDKAGLETYLPHPDHKAFVDIIKPHLEEVFVFDYTAKSE